MRSGTLKAILLLLVLALAPSSATSQSAQLDQLFEQLADPETQNWQKVENEIWTLWSRSGSAAMDLLLARGREAMSGGDMDVAIEHFTALTDHAPDFAEGWNARATAYFHAGLFGPSIQDIQRTLALNPRHFGALSGLGMILVQLDMTEDALDAYRAALVIHPHSINIKTTIKRLEKLVGGTDL
ncbi:MAG: tetratricopeptide repeat protein [Paracoccaceae bacterium]